MRVIAILGVYNEERFIASSLSNLIHQGCEVYLCDNESEDRTVAIAERYLGRGLIGIETIPRSGTFRWRSILHRKEELAATLDADWFLHVDADEVHVSPNSAETLAQALARADAEGYNAVNFFEFTFIPTREAPDHDHPGFQKTMRWYYPFAPCFPHLVRAWKRTSARVDLVESGGHHVRFHDLRLCPRPFRLRHYLFLSVDHAIEKYVRKLYDSREVAQGWHGWRARVRSEDIHLPPAAALRLYLSDDRLDPSNPRTRHWLDEQLSG